MSESKEFKTTVDPSLREDFLLVRGEDTFTPPDPKNYCPTCGFFPLPVEDYGRCCANCRAGVGTMFPLDIFIQTYRRYEIQLPDPSRHDALLSPNGVDAPAAPIAVLGYGEATQSDQPGVDDAELRYPVWQEIKPYVAKLMHVDVEKVNSTHWKKFKSLYKASTRMDDEQFLKLKTGTFLETLRQWDEIASDRPAAAGGSGKLASILLGDDRRTPYEIAYATAVERHQKGLPAPEPQDDTPFESETIIPEGQCTACEGLGFVCEDCGKGYDGCSCGEIQDEQGEYVRPGNKRCEACDGTGELAQP